MSLNVFISLKFDRFNRYMVECEFRFKRLRVRIRHRFNRYMVECEFYFDCISHFYQPVLIDTWWNVNMVTASFLKCCQKVLIDTWWNVNQNFVDSLLKISGFNRYMVECEYPQL